MLNIKQHDTIMRRILVALYSSSKLKHQIAFKGGTCLYLFYKLDRFSTDLDFNILVNGEDFDPQVVTDILGKIINLQHVDKKFNTWLWKGSHEKGGYGVKIEISKRNYPDTYTTTNFYGFTIPTMTLDCMFAHKLCAILDRKTLQNRDLYDAYFLLKQNCPIKEEIIKLRNNNLSTSEYLQKLIDQIPHSLKSKNSILEGLGEVLNESQKSWVKDNLLNTLLFELEMRK